MPVEACSGLWRSEDMVLLNLHMQREVAHDAVLKLGEIGMFQFLDLNADVSAFQRDFVTEIRRCDEIERRLRFLQDEIDRAGVSSVTDGTPEKETMFSLEQKVDAIYNEVSQLNDRYQALIEERNRSKEHLEMLSRGIVCGDGVMLVAGVIPKDRLPILTRVVYRASRGNSILRTEEIETPFYNINSNEGIYKSVFAIYFSASHLKDKLVRICEVNGGTVYKCPDSEEQVQQMRESLQHQVETVTQTLQQSSYRQRQVLLGIASSCYEWRRAVVTEKAVYSAMNLLKFSGSTAVARGWAPVRAYEDIRAAILEAESLGGAQVGTIIEEVPTKDTLPRTSRPIRLPPPFRVLWIVTVWRDTRRRTPGVFTIITFPYLFGIMYGDIGHGLILTLFAAYLVFSEKSFEGKPLNEIFAMIFGGRYLLLLMGFFAVYMGVLYNDMFGFSVELFSSGYRWPQLPPNGPDGVVYPSFPNGCPSVNARRPHHLRRRLRVGRDGEQAGVLQLDQDEVLRHCRCCPDDGRCVHLPLQLPVL
ncbi:V-type H+-transporting ATPase subunit I [Angomonas deanei]|nr:V-type H+-transporting ATPase subunit I [Angomonas deanei]|eukprot:EPY26290.1 V-type H+-transporting ATPase subunit I [Angomonas deanei]